MKQLRKANNPHPQFMTITEAASVLCISRNAAYAAAQRYRTTEGSEGLPNLKVGGTLRVPVDALHRMAQLSIPGSAA